MLLKLKRYCNSLPCSSEELFNIAWLFGLFAEKCYKCYAGEQQRLWPATDAEEDISFLVLAGTANAVTDASTGEVTLHAYTPISMPSPFVPSVNQRVAPEVASVDSRLKSFKKRVTPVVTVGRSSSSARQVEEEVDSPPSHFSADASTFSKWDLSTGDTVVVMGPNGGSQFS